ncbi:MAG: hypothetical protein GC193_06680 [Cryomorphaceae bacterium]|nr:hypothetical protein [Cryomorphaceae bacterium]
MANLIVSGQCECPFEKFHVDTQRMSYLCDNTGAVLYHRAWDFNGVMIFEQEDSIGIFSSSTVVKFYENGQLKEANTSIQSSSADDGYVSQKVWSEEGKLIRSEIIKGGVPETVIEVKYNEKGQKEEVIQCQPVPEEYQTKPVSDKKPSHDEAQKPMEDSLPKLLVFSKEELKMQAKLLKIYLKQQKELEKNQK